SANSWALGWNSNLTDTHEEGDTNSSNWGVHADATVSVTATGSAGVNVGVFNAGGSLSTMAGLTVGGNYGQSRSHEASNSVSGSFGKNFEDTHMDSRAVTVGHDHTESDTESFSYEQSETVGKGGDVSDMVSTSTTHTDTTSVHVLPGLQAMVYR